MWTEELKVRTLEIISELASTRMLRVEANSKSPPLLSRRIFSSTGQVTVSPAHLTTKLRHLFKKNYIHLSPDNIPKRRLRCDHLIQKFVILGVCLKMAHLLNRDSFKIVSSKLLRSYSILKFSNNREWWESCHPIIRNRKTTMGSGRKLNVDGKKAILNRVQENN